MTASDALSSTPSKPPRKRRTQAERREAARERLLDAAEELFGKRGYYGVTLRDVAAHADTDTPLLHYYFGDKASLFEEVVSRRAQLVNEARLASLEAYEREHKNKMTARGVVRAYLGPTFDLLVHGGAGMRHYGRVIAKVNSTSADDETRLSATPFDPVVHKLIGMLKQVRPGASQAQLYWFYHMLSGAITLSLAETGRIDALSGGRCKSSDFATILERMTDIFGAGLAGLREEDKPRSPRSPRANG